MCSDASEQLERASAPRLRVYRECALETSRCRSARKHARRVTVTAAGLGWHALPLARDSFAREDDKLKLMWDLTFDMSGVFGLAQPAQRRPLDGGVRRHRRHAGGKRQPHSTPCDTTHTLLPSVSRK